MIFFFSHDEHNMRLYQQSSFSHLHERLRRASHFSSIRFGLKEISPFCFLTNLIDEPPSVELRRGGDDTVDRRRSFFYFCVVTPAVVM
jgi:hypothetical protein